MSYATIAREASFTVWLLSTLQRVASACWPWNSMTAPHASTALSKGTVTRRKSKKARKREHPRVCTVNGLTHRLVWIQGVAWVLDCNGHLPGPGSKTAARTPDTVVTCLWCVAIYP